MKSSVIIPHCNKRPQMLIEAIDSCIRQTIPFDEIIIIYGDSSIDAWQKMNKGVRQSTGDVFIVLSDDDRLEPNFLETCMHIMITKNCDIVSTGICNFNNEHGMHYSGPIPFFTSMCRRALFDSLGGWDSNMIAFGDTDFWYRAIQHGSKIERTADTFYWYRKHEEQASNSIDFDASRVAFLAKHNLTKMP